MGVTIITQRLYAKSKQGCMALFDSPPPTISHAYSDALTRHCANHDLILTKNLFQSVAISGPPGVVERIAHHFNQNHRVLRGRAAFCIFPKAERWRLYEGCQSAEAFDELGTDLFK